jgi:hypothetical protein
MYIVIINNYIYQIRGIYAAGDRDTDNGGLCFSKSLQL